MLDDQDRSVGKDPECGSFFCVGQILVDAGSVMLRRIKVAGVISFIAISVMAGWNYIALQRPLSEVIDKDPRNAGISIFVHYQGFVNPNVVVFDLRDIASDKSPLDVSRVFLQYADGIQKKSFSKVVLACKGVPKFLLKGEYFHVLGREYDFQNPVYTLRMLPGHVYNLDGTPAFGTWAGGWLGVVSKQMRDLNDFHKRWYLTDFASGT